MSEGDDQYDHGCKYLLIGCYTFPVTRDGASLLPVPGQEETDQPLPGLDEELEEMDHGGDGVDQVLPEEDEPMEEAEAVMSERPNPCMTPGIVWWKRPRMSRSNT